MTLLSGVPLVGDVIKGVDENVFEPLGLFQGGADEEAIAAARARTPNINQSAFSNPSSDLEQGLLNSAYAAPRDVPQAAIPGFGFGGGGGGGYAPAPVPGQAGVPTPTVPSPSPIVGAPGGPSLPPPGALTTLGPGPATVPAGARITAAANPIGGFANPANQAIAPVTGPHTVSPGARVDANSIAQQGITTGRLQSVGPQVNAFNAANAQPQNIIDAAIGQLPQQDAGYRRSLAARPDVSIPTAQLGAGAQQALSGRPDVTIGNANRQILDTGQLAPGLGVTGGAVANSEAARDLQLGSAGRLSQAAQGQAPSAAEIQLRQGLDRGLRQNLALASSARGGGAAQVLARRGASAANASLAAQTNANAAALRADEQARARALETQALQGIRAADLQGGQLGLGIGQLGLGAAQSQLSADQAIALNNAQLQAQGRLSELGAETTRLGQGIGAETSLAQANLQAQTQGRLAELGAETTRLGAATAAEVAQNNARLQAGSQLALGQLNAQQAVSIANMDAQLRSRGLDDEARFRAMGQLLGIDARTQDGQIQLQRLLAESSIQAQTINANLAVGAGTNQATQQAATTSGIATAIAALA